VDTVTTYATLKAAIPGMMKRDGDTQITENVALFIQLCEADFPDRLFPREEEYDTALTAALNSATIDLPSDYISPIALWLVIDSERIQLRQIRPQDLPYDSDSAEPSAIGAWLHTHRISRYDATAASAIAQAFAPTARNARSGEPEPPAPRCVQPQTSALITDSRQP